MDFTISPRIEDYRDRIARFVEDELLPVEADRTNYDAHENIRKDVLGPLRDKAKAEGQWRDKSQKHRMPASSTRWRPQPIRRSLTVSYASTCRREA